MRPASAAIAWMVGASLAMGACASSLRTEVLASNDAVLGAALAETRDTVHLQTRSQGVVLLRTASIEGEQICGAPPRAPAGERQCYDRDDIETVSVTRWKDDAGATAQVYGVMVGCVVLLPLCLAKGASGVGQ